MQGDTKSVDDFRSQATEVLQSLQLANVKEERLALLDRVSHLLLVDCPGIVVDIFPHIAALHRDTLPAFRFALINLIERCCRLAPSLIEQFYGTLAPSIVRDTNSRVQKRAFQALNRLFKPALSFILVKLRDTTEAAASESKDVASRVWLHLTQTKDLIAKALDPKHSEYGTLFAGGRIQCIKFLESWALVFSPNDFPSEGRTGKLIQLLNNEIGQPDAIFGSFESVRQSATAALRLIGQELVRPESTTQTITVAIASLRTTARHAQALGLALAAPAILELTELAAGPLATLSARLPNVSTKFQRMSIIYALRMAIIGMIKLKLAGAFRNQLRDAAISVGYGSQANSVINFIAHYEHEKGAAQAPVMMDEDAEPRISVADFEEIMTRAPLPMVVEWIVSILRDPRLKIPEDYADAGPAGVSDAVAARIDAAVALEEQEEREAEALYWDVGDDDTLGVDQLSDSGDLADDLDEELDELTLSRMRWHSDHSRGKTPASMYELGQMLDVLVRQICSSETLADVEQEGTTALWASVVQRVVVPCLCAQVATEGQPLGLRKLLIDIIINNIHSTKGLPLALRTLYQLYLQHVTSRPDVSGCFEPYCGVLAELFERMCDILDESGEQSGIRDKIVQLLLQAPYVPQDFIATVAKLANPSFGALPAPSDSPDETDHGAGRDTDDMDVDEDDWGLDVEPASACPSCFKSSLVFLREVAVRRPALRCAAVEALLKLTDAPHGEVRESAVRLIVNQLWGVCGVDHIIREFIEGRLASILAKLPNSSADGAPPVSEQAFKQSIVRYLALCGREPSLLGSLSETFSSVPVQFKKVIMREISELTISLGAAEPLLAIVRGVNSNTELLVLRIIHLIGEHFGGVLQKEAAEHRESPHADQPLVPSDATVNLLKVIATVKCIYPSRVNDVRFVVPVVSYLSPQEIMPLLTSVLNLPPSVGDTALGRMISFGLARLMPEPGALTETQERTLGVDVRGTLMCGISPVDLLACLHILPIAQPPEGTSTKRVIESTQKCFAHLEVFTGNIIIAVLQRLITRETISPMFLRTAIQALAAYPDLKRFIITSTLPALIQRRVWEMPVLWHGVIRLLALTQPESFPIMLSLPPPQLTEITSKIDNLRDQLASWVQAGGPRLLHSIPPQTRLVLGIQ